jgi:phosphoribosylformylglycinamidine synthase subunit PurQ / glutaminase
MLLNRKKTIHIWYWPGTNCERESIAACKKVGASPKLVMVNDLIQRKVRVTDCDLVWWPGGFSGGDYISCGVIAASMIKDIMLEFLASGIPGLFICNGFQIAMRAKAFGPGLSLVTNDSETFCSHPVKHLVLESNCLWTKGLEGRVLHFPSAHGGGKLVGDGKKNVVMKYHGFSPNGGDVAALTNEAGNLLGIMDHTERPYGNADGLEILANGIKAV